MNNVMKIAPDDARRALAVCMKAKVTPLMIGPVGCGKTTTVIDFVNHLKDKGVPAELRIAILSQMDISDFALPKEIDGRVHQCPAAWIPLKKDEKKDDPFFFLMLDEIDRASPDIQNMALNLILGRNIAGEELSSKVVFIAAGNGTSDIYTTALSRAMINRLCVLYIGGSFESYEKWALENDISPARIAFQKFHGETLIDHKDEFEDISFPTNRSLDAVDRIVSLIDSGRCKFKTDDILMPLVAGLIGVPAALEYKQFINMYKNLPMPDEVLADPKNVDVSNLEQSSLYALMQSVVRYAHDDLDKSEKAFQFFSVLQPEFCKAGCTSLIQKNPDAVTCKTYCKMQNA